MTDREKVMRGLMHHSVEEIPITCDNCPYDDDEPYCSQRLAADALALLKEKEEIVKCEDCIYFEKPGATGTGVDSPIGWCKRAGAGCGHSTVFFCAGGMRKENGNNKEGSES